MAKLHLVVLGYLNKKPMYGYQIGHTVTEHKFLIGSDVKLPSIYKALQVLEARELISGEEVSDGNNPPRTVFTITPAGKLHLKNLIVDTIMDKSDVQIEFFWAVIGASNYLFRKNELMDLISYHKNRLLTFPTIIEVREMIALEDPAMTPIGGEQMIQLGREMLDAQIRSIKKLELAIHNNDYDKYFIQ